MVKRKTQIEPKIEKEAWKFHCWSIVDYCVTLFGTLTTTNPTNKLSLNYDQVFLRDFTSESSIVGAHTLGQTAEWFKSALAFERIRGNLSLSGYFACGQDGGVQLPRAYVEDHHTIHGLPPLLNDLSNSHANIRAKAVEVELNERPVHVSFPLKEGFNLLLFVQELNERPVRVSLATARVTRTELGCISGKKRLIRLWTREEKDIAIVTHNGFLEATSLEIYCEAEYIPVTV
nr:leishmanolysin-like peptidase [Tanacetum cinerariifolium]